MRFMFGDSEDFFGRPAERSSVEVDLEFICEYQNQYQFYT